MECPDCGHATPTGKCPVCPAFTFVLRDISKHTSPTKSEWTFDMWLTARMNKAIDNARLKIEANFERELVRHAEASATAMENVQFRMEEKLRRTDEQIVVLLAVAHAHTNP